MVVHVFNTSLVSGPETLVWPALAVARFDVQIIWLKESRVALDKQTHVEQYLGQLGLSYKVIEVNSRWDKNAIRKLRQILEDVQQNIQIAHAHDVKASVFLLSAVRAMKQKKPLLVSTHHGVRARSLVRAALYEKYYSYFILPHYDLVLSVCSDDREILLRRGLQPERVKVHLNGVTRHFIAESERNEIQKNIREQWVIENNEARQLKNNFLIFGIVARVEEGKRHDLLLEVIYEIKKRKPEMNFQVICFGRGSLLSKMQLKTKKMNLQEQVLWMGYRPNLGEEFAGFDALISFSKAEGLPINLIEAGWAATPVFACAVDGVKDLIPNSNLGDLFSVDEPFHSLVDKFLNFAQSHEQLRKKGLLFQDWVTKNFSQKKWLEQLEAYYINLTRESFNKKR